jgi:hypothetical protein
MLFYRGTLRQIEFVLTGAFLLPLLGHKHPVRRVVAKWVSSEPDSKEMRTGSAQIVNAYPAGKLTLKVLAAHAHHKFGS